MTDNTLFLIDNKKGYRGSIIDTVENWRLGCSGMTVDEYAKASGIEPLVLTWEELKPIIQGWEEKNLLTKFTEITEEFFYEMFEVLPPMRFTRISKGFLFFLSEMTSGIISACYIQYEGKHYTAQKRTTDSIEKLLNEFFQDIGKDPIK